MTITKTQDGTDLTIKVEGRLDTITAPELEAEIREDLDIISNLTLDFADLEYISSAGLRLLLIAQKSLSNRGGLKITGANETIREIFEVTGFSEILTVE